MQFTSKEELADMLRFVERQTVFTIETTAKIETYHDFLASQEAMVLFNSTCMCLQTIGETIRRVMNAQVEDFLPVIPKHLGRR